MDDAEFKAKVANTKIDPRDLHTVPTEFEVDEAVEPTAPTPATLRPTDIDPVTGKCISNPRFHETEYEVDDAVADDSFDWRTTGKVVDVRDQGQCGSCWAFSSSDAVASAWAIKTNTAPLLLAPQYLIDCNTHADGDSFFTRNWGCHGGSPQIAYRWMRTNPHVLEKNYPYQAAGGICHGDSVPKTPVKTSGAGFVPANGEAALMAELKKGPVVVFIAAENEFRHYSKGVMTTGCAGTQDHLVLLIGYGTEKGVPYWLIKNSWRKTWGDGGYVKLKRGINLCGVETFANRPVV